MAAKTQNTNKKHSTGHKAKVTATAPRGGAKAKVATPRPKATPAAHAPVKAKAAPARKPAPAPVKEARASKPAHQPAATAHAKPAVHAKPVAHHTPAGARPAAHTAAHTAAKPHVHVAPKPVLAPVAHAAPASKLPVQHAVRPAVSAPLQQPRPVLAPGHRPASHGPSLQHKRPHFGHHQSGQLPRDVIERNPTLKLDPNKKKTLQRHGFRTSEYVVYPSHGVGKIVAIEEQVVAGHALELFVINFEQEKMTLRVPTAKLAAVGMRKLSEDGIVRRAMETLKGRARIKRTMWSRRAQEYETKINSGDLVSISEVVRDLYRAETQPEQSYSERQLFEAALDRMSREIAAIEKLDERGAVQKITEVLSKSAKGRAASKAAEEAASTGGEVGEGQAA